MRIVINGTGIAGPTLAYWLQKAGHEVLLVEIAPQLRTGGYIIDFGLVGYDVAEKMGLIPRIRKLGYQVEELRFVNERGRRRGSIPMKALDRIFHGRFTSVKRSDLAITIYESLPGTVETIFGDSIAGIEEREHDVLVSFDHAPPRAADLVIGADGLHSRVRELVFGPDAGVELALGYHVAAFEAEGYRPRDELVYLGHGAPGRQIFRFSMRDDKTLFLFVFRDEYLGSARAFTEQERKAAVTKAFADVGWECPAILDAMSHAGDIYFDRVSQIRMDRWTKGRTALVGDAGACVSLLAGEGAGLAMAEAYILAGELRDCAGNYTSAFAQYQERLMPLIKRKQYAAAKFASSFAPKTGLGVAFRDFATGMMRLPWLMDFFFGRELRDKIELPDYGFEASPYAVYKSD
jgi:2-polyprenyl-6-methoxyphenol hydroxylase-like FAD-dependent oxidoreductase